MPYSETEVVQRKLIEEHVGLARHLARYYTHWHRLGDDAVGVALLGLVEAAQDWEPTRTPDFSKHARHRVKQALLKAMQRAHGRRQGEGGKRVYRDRPVPVGPDVRAGEVDPADHRAPDCRTPGDVDAEDEVCWLLGRLRPDQASMLRMRFWEGLSAQEVAGAEGVLYNSVRHQLAKTLTYLRDQLFASYRRLPGSPEPDEPGMQDRRKWESGLFRWQGRYWRLPDLAKHLGIPYPTLHRRVYRYRWPLERAFTEPVRVPGRPARETSVPA